MNLRLLCLAVAVLQFAAGNVETRIRIGALVGLRSLVHVTRAVFSRSTEAMNEQNQNRTLAGIRVVCGVALIDPLQPATICCGIPGTVSVTR